MRVKKKNSESKAEALSLLGKQEYFFFSIVILDKWNKRQKNDINNAMMITSKQTNTERYQHMNHGISVSEREREAVSATMPSYCVHMHVYEERQAAACRRNKEG